MLNSVYLESLDKLSYVTQHLTDAQLSLLNAINSKSRFEQLMEALPDDWEKTHKLNFYTDIPSTIYAFRNLTKYKGKTCIYERTVLSVIVNDKHKAVPSSYYEHLKRDYDYPPEEDKWKVDHDLTEFVPASFHVDHRLIWIMSEKEVNPDSNIPIQNADATYSINVYIPSAETLANVETLKLNNYI